MHTLVLVLVCSELGLYSFRWCLPVQSQLFCWYPFMFFIIRPALYSVCKLPIEILFTVIPLLQRSCSLAYLACLDDLCCRPYYSSKLETGQFIVWLAQVDWYWLGGNDVIRRQERHWQHDTRPTTRCGSKFHNDCLCVAIDFGQQHWPIQRAVGGSKTGKSHSLCWTNVYLIANQFLPLWLLTLTSRNLPSRRTFAFHQCNRLIRVCGLQGMQILR